MMRVLVTGASGLLGVNLSLVLSQQGYQVVGWVNSNPLPNAPFLVETINLIDLADLERRIMTVKPDLIIHCAALANLDLAEANPELAYLINTDVTEQIAKTAARERIQLVHISTDAVFDGVKGGYSETDLPNPVSVYAQSKFAAERVIQQINPEAIIARVNFYGWSLSGKRSLAEFFYNNLSAGRQMNGFTDVLFCPLYVEDLSKLLIEMAAKHLAGLYHVVSAERISKYDFGVAIARKFGFDESLIKPVSVQQSGLTAARSLNLNLNTDKLSHDLGLCLPGIDEGLEAFYSAHQAGLPGKLMSFLNAN